MENIWEFLSQNLLSHGVSDSYDAIVDACCHAWSTLMSTPELIASVTRRSWAQASPRRHLSLRQRSGEPLVRGNAPPHQQLDGAIINCLHPGLR